MLSLNAAIEKILQKDSFRGDKKEGQARNADGATEPGDILPILPKSRF